MRKNIYLLITICISLLTIIQCNNKDQDKKDSSKNSNSYSCNVNSDICECMEIQLSIINKLEDLAKNSNANEFKNMNYTEKKEARKLFNSLGNNMMFLRRNRGNEIEQRKYVNNNCNHINKSIKEWEENIDLYTFYKDLQDDTEKDIRGKDKE